MSILGLGEILFRLSPPELGALNTARSLDVHVGGCEANTLATLSALGVPTRMLSAVPDHVMGDLAIRPARQRHGLQLDPASAASHGHLLL